MVSLYMVSALKSYFYSLLLASEKSRRDNSNIWRSKGCTNIRSTSCYLRYKSFAPARYRRVGYQTLNTRHNCTTIFLVLGPIMFFFSSSISAFTYMDYILSLVISRM
jgi:hypothetical protein